MYNQEGKPILDAQFLRICFLEPILTSNSLLVRIQIGNQKTDIWEEEIEYMYLETWKITGRSRWSKGQGEWLWASRKVKTVDSQDAAIDNISYLQYWHRKLTKGSWKLLQTSYLSSAHKLRATSGVNNGFFISSVLQVSHNCLTLAKSTLLPAPRKRFLGM